MSKTVIKIENLSKQYRLGVPIAIGRGSSTLRDSLSRPSGKFARTWAKVRGKEDPTLLIGQANELATPTTNNRQPTTSDNYVWALRDINLEVKQGEITSYI